MSLRSCHPGTALRFVHDRGALTEWSSDAHYLSAVPAVNATTMAACRRGAWMLVAVVFGVLLAIGFFVAVALPTFTGDYPGTLWSLLLVLLAGAWFLCLGMVRGHARNARAVRRAQVALVAGAAFLCTSLTIALLLVHGYTD